MNSRDAPSHANPSSVRLPLSPRQKQMLIESKPDDITGEEGCGVELQSGADYAIAKNLVARGFGYRSGPGGSLPGMYWSNSDGLLIRSELLGNRKDGASLQDPTHG